MADLVDRPRFDDESLDRRGRRDVRSQHFDRDRFVYERMNGLVDGAEATGSEPALDPVVAHHGALLELDPVLVAVASIQIGRGSGNRARGGRITRAATGRIESVLPCPRFYPGIAREVHDPSV